MQILNHIPGFRSKNNIKIFIAILYYIATIAMVILGDTFKHLGFSITMIPFIIFSSIFLINGYGDEKERKVNIQLLSITSLVFDIYVIKLGYLLYESINTFNMEMFTSFNLNIIELIIAIALILWGIAATILSIMKMIEHDKDTEKLRGLSNVLLCNITLIIAMLIFIFKNNILIWIFSKIPL